MSSVDINAELVAAAARFWTNACPALITRAERSRFRPRIDRSRPQEPVIGFNDVIRVLPMDLIGSDTVVDGGVTATERPHHAGTRALAMLAEAVLTINAPGSHRLTLLA